MPRQAVKEHCRCFCYRHIATKLAGIVHTHGNFCLLLLLSRHQDTYFSKYWWRMATVCWAVYRSVSCLRGASAFTARRDLYMCWESRVITLSQFRQSLKVRAYDVATGAFPGWASYDPQPTTQRIGSLRHRNSTLCELQAQTSWMLSNAHYDPYRIHACVPYPTMYWTGKKAYILDSSNNPQL